MNDFGGARRVQDEGLDELLFAYGITSLYLFTNLRNFKAKCSRDSKDLIEGKDIPQYLAFQHVKPAIADQIDRHLEDHRGLPHMTISTIVELSNEAHGWCTACSCDKMFGSILQDKVDDQAIHRQLINLGSSRFGLASSSRSKTADASYKPKTRILERVIGQVR